MIHYSTKLFSFYLRVGALLSIWIVLLFSSRIDAVDLSQEQVGGAGLNQTFQALAQYLGKPIFSREIYDETSRCWVSIAHFEEEKKHKVQVELCRNSRRLKIRSIRALGDSQAQTSQRVGIGSKLTDLIKVYKNIRIIGDDCVVVEDSLNAITLRFLIERGKVSEINFYFDPTLKDRFPDSDFSQIF